MLDLALALAGIARDQVYLTNAVKHFKWTQKGKRRIHETPHSYAADAVLTFRSTGQKSVHWAQVDARRTVSQTVRQ